MIRIVPSDRQFADVTADRITLQNKDIIRWAGRAQMGRHHQRIIDPLEIVEISPKPQPRRTRRRTPSPRPVPLLLPRPH